MTLHPLEEQLTASIEQEDYRSAYQLFRDLQQQVRDGLLIDGNIADYRTQIEGGAAAKHNTLTTQLNDVLSVVTEMFDVVQAKGLLTQLETAVLSETLEDDTDYRGLSQRVHAKEQEKKQIEAYQRARKEVEALWNQGYSEVDRDSDQRTVLSYFTRAEERAREALSEYPNNTLLETLFDRAEKERERMAQVENVMISGGQTEDFVTVLRFINNARDEQSLPVYNPRDDSLIGNFRKEEARQEVLNQARPFVRDKLDTYLKDADAALNRHEPRKAQAEFERTNKFEELWQMVPDIITAAESTRHTQTRRSIEEALGLLQRAESDAQRADERAESDLLTAWSDFAAAQALYPGAQKSKIVIDARDSIRDKSLNYLRREADQLDLRFNSRDFQAVNEQATRLYESYNEIDALSDSEVLKRIADLRNRSGDVLLRQSNIAKELGNILNLAVSNPRQASDDFKKLRQRYDADLLKEDAQFARAQDVVQGALSIEERLTNFEAALQSSDLDAVQEAGRRAQEWAQNPNLDTPEQRQYQTRFQQVAQQLALYDEFLQAERLSRARSNAIEGHKEAIQNLQDFLQQKRAKLNERLKERVENTYQKLQQDLQVLQNNAYTLNSVEDHFKLGAKADDIDELLRQLDLVTTFVDGDQRAAWSNLLQRTLQLISLTTRFDVKRVDTLLRRLGEFNSAMQISWESRLRDFKIAEQARIDGESGRYEKAEQNWQSIQENFGGDEQRYITQKLNSIHRKLNQRSKETLLDQVAQLDSSNLDYWLNNMNNLAAEMKALATTAADRKDRLFYMTSTLELDILSAQREPDIDNRVKRLRAVAQYANQAVFPTYTQVDLERGKDDEALGQIRHAKVWLAMALVAPEIASALQSIDHDVTNRREDIAVFKAALATWQQAFEQLPERAQALLKNNDMTLNTYVEMHYQASLLWYNTTMTAIRQQLKEKLEEADQDPDNPEAKALPYLAKLYFLKQSEPSVEQRSGDRMLEQLEQLETKLCKDLADLIDDYPKASRYTGASAVEVFKAQSRAINRNYEYITLVSEVLRQFPAEIEGLTGTIPKDQLAASLRNYEQIYDKVLETHQLVGERTRQFKDDLKGTALDVDNMGDFAAVVLLKRSTYTDSIKTLMRSLQTSISGSAINAACPALDPSQLPQTPEQHPYIQDAIKEATEHSRLNTDIATRVQAIVTALEAERIDESRNKLQRFNYDTEEIWTTSPLYYDIQAETPSGLKRGWRNIVAMIDGASTVLRDFEDWYKPHYDPADHERDDVPDSPGVVSWDAIDDPEIRALQQQVQTPIEEYMTQFYGDVDEKVQAYYKPRVENHTMSEGVRYQAEYLLARGDFQAARTLLHVVIGNPTEADFELPPGRMSLQDAVDYFGHPPLLDDSDTTRAATYEAAREAVQSETIKAILDQMETHRYQRYQDALKEAQSLLRRIDDTEQQWKTLRSEIGSELQVLSQKNTAYDKAWRKEAARRNVEAALEAVNKLIKKARQLCPLHPDIGRYADNVDIGAAHDIIEGAR